MPSSTSIMSVVPKIMDCLARMVDKAMATRSHFISMEEQKELLRGMQLKNDLAEENLDLFKQLKEAYLDKAAEELENITNSPEDGNEKGRAKLSLEKLSFLLDKGMEIYSYMDVPSEVQLLFPAIDMQKQITDNMKYITEKKTDDSDNGTKE